MRKLAILLVVVCATMFAYSSYADEINAGDIHIEYDSLDQLKEIYVAVQKQMGSQYKTILLDADTYESATFIIGESFPAGRYYIYPVGESDDYSAKYIKFRWWSKEDVNNESCTDYFLVDDCKTIELTDGMKFRIHWEDNQLGIYVAIHKLPEDQFNLMDVFD